jgi:hypothetical protein
MSTRTWLYQQLTTDQRLNALVEGRVFPKKSMKSSVEEHPYIIYKLGNGTNYNLSETVDVTTQFFQLYVHDYTDTEVGDYLKIDDIIAELKRILHLGSSAEHGVISTLYLETSQDLNDETLGTVMKYVRFQSMVKGSQ